jgi:NitT/TauT family transport system substrate-binding protein
MKRTNREAAVRIAAVLVLTSLVATLAAGCAPAPASSEDGKLKLGVLPILDVIPFFVAEQNGYFKEQGLQVEMVAVKSAQERDALMQTGQIDGVINDLIAVGLFNKESTKIKVVHTGRLSFPGAPQFRVLAAPNAKIEKPADLKGVPVGISQNTVIEYITDRMLRAEGLAPADISVQEVTAIPVRYEQLLNGNIKAATLPDPLGQGAIAAGARLIVDDTKYPQYSQSVVSFRVDTLTAKPNTVKKFLLAYEKAARELNANPTKYQGLLVEQGRVPKAIEGSYKMPPFPEKGIPEPAQVSDAVQWMKEKKLIARDLAYADMVDASFLPK